MMDNMSDSCSKNNWKLFPPFFSPKFEYIISILKNFLKLGNKSKDIAMYIKHLKNFIHELLFMWLMKMSPFIPTRYYLKLQFLLLMWYRLNLKKPCTFNEKLQRLKLYDKNPKYVKMVDKYSAKEYVSDIIWKEHIIPTLWVRNSFDDIDFNKLPDQFVLKCTHDCWSVVICKNKKTFDKNMAKRILQSALNHNYYYNYKEWVYKDIQPRIIAEKYMVDEQGIALKDYKVFCFNGEPKVIMVDIDRFSNHKANMYDLDRNFLPLEFHWLSSDKNYHIKKPKILNKILESAKDLSNNIPHVRVDFYVLNEKFYFWELTFYHGAWITKFYPHEWDLKFWSWIKLPKII